MPGLSSNNSLEIVNEHLEESILSHEQPELLIVVQHDSDSGNEASDLSSDLVNANQYDTTEADEQHDLSHDLSLHYQSFGILSEEPDESDSDHEHSDDSSDQSNELLPEDVVALADEAPSTNCFERYPTVKHVVRTMGIPTSKSFMFSNALNDLLLSIFAGYPELVPKIAKMSAKYQMPATAIPIVLLGVLHELKINGTKTTQNVIVAATGGLGLAAFSIPMIMELITGIVDLIKNQPRSSDVQIPNWTAGLIMGACSVLGLAHSFQTYYLKINAQNPLQPKSRINELMTSEVALILFAALNSACGFHGAALATMNLVPSAPGSNIPFAQETIPFFTRIGITGTAAVLGGLAGASADSDSHLGVQVFDFCLEGAFLVALGIGYAEKYYISPNAEKVFGHEVIKEQTWLWSAVVPLIPTVFLMLQLLGLKGPELWQAAITTFANMMNYFRQASPQPDETTPLLEQGHTSTRVATFASQRFFSNISTNGTNRDTPLHSFIDVTDANPEDLHITNSDNYEGIDNLDNALA